jgi:hypothetical protein
LPHPEEQHKDEEKSRLYCRQHLFIRVPATVHQFPIAHDQTIS